MSIVRWSVLPLPAILLLFAAAPTAAQDSPSGWYFEGFWGNYESGIDGLDEEDPAGLRLGFRRQKKLGYELSFAKLEGQIKGFADTDLGSIDIDWEADAWDLSVTFHPILRGGLQFLVLGGPGYATVNARAIAEVSEGTSIRLESLSEDSFTAHGGLAFKIFLTETFYLRLDGRGRWYEAREDDNFDVEYTLAIGANW